MHHWIVGAFVAFIFFVSDRGVSRASADWVEDLRRAGDFLSRLQLSDGSIDEGENFSYIYLINTPRAIAAWSHYGLVSGDTTRFQTEIDLAWTYVDQNRPDLEVTKYLALEASGFTLIAASYWRELTGDTSRDTYMNELVTFITSSTINPGIPTEVHSLSQGYLGIGMFGDQTGNVQYQTDAMSGAQYIKSLVEGNTSLLSAEAGEESGGMAFSAVARYAFSSPVERKTWVESYYPFLETCLTNGIYSNSHTAWYVYAQYLAWEYGVELTARTNALDSMTKLIDEDRESDGGIPNQYGGPINSDKAWASEVRYWALTQFGAKGDFAIASEASVVFAGGQPLYFDYGLANNELTPSLYFIVAFMDIPSFGLSYVGTFAIFMPAGAAFVQNQVPLNIASGSPTGPWTLRVSIYDSQGRFQELETMSFTVL